MLATQHCHMFKNWQWWWRISVDQLIEKWAGSTPYHRYIKSCTLYCNIMRSSLLRLNSYRLLLKSNSSIFSNYADTDTTKHKLQLQHIKIYAYPASMPTSDPSGDHSLYETLMGSIKYSWEYWQGISPKWYPHFLDQMYVHDGRFPGWYCNGSIAYFNCFVPPLIFVSPLSHHSFSEVL